MWRHLPITTGAKQLIAKKEILQVHALSKGQPLYSTGIPIPEYISKHLGQWISTFFLPRPNRATHYNPATLSKTRINEM